MRSLLDDYGDLPAVSAFLDALDKVMNSNSFLLTVRTDEPVGDPCAVLSAFVHDDLFRDMLVTADQRRDWWNLSDWPGDEPVLDPVARAGARLAVEPLDAAGLAPRLRCMLTEAYSPYGRFRDPADADELVAAFLRALLGEHAGEHTPGPIVEPAVEPADEHAGWTFVTIRPDFLYSSEYFTDTNPEPLHYFDGGAGDTATAFLRGRVCHLLLTNGCP